MRSWYRNRQVRKAQEAEDRLHGRNAKPVAPRRSRGGSGDWDEDLTDLVLDGIGWLVSQLFKIFD